MRIDNLNPNFAEITLSRRNLLSLLHKLDMPGSHRTLEKVERGKAAVLVVHAEDDAEHYGDRPAGPMHELTEAFVRDHTGEVTYRVDNS
jgi:hypothetical protein